LRLLCSSCWRSCSFARARVSVIFSKSGEAAIACSISFSFARKAEQKLTEYVGERDKDLHLEPTKLTVGQQLDDWFKVVSPQRAENTRRLYTTVITNHLKPALGHILLQKLQARDVERYYLDKKLSPASMRVHHAVLSCALKSAKRKRLIRDNVAVDAENKPKVPERLSDNNDNVWSVEEAQRFLRKLKANGNPQETALFSLALHTGMRRGELLGLQWKDLNGNKLRIERQLFEGGTKDPVFIPPKRGGVRTVHLSDTTPRILLAHKRKQAELKMRNRTVYKDHGLMFAQEWEHISSKHAVLGRPLYPASINTRLTTLCKAAKVRVIKVRGLRHTCATLWISAGVSSNVVQKRLGHKRVEMTMSIYSHALPSVEIAAADDNDEQLHG
jgi:integrase